MSSASAAPEPLSLFQTIDSMSGKELDALPQGVIQLDAQGTILQYNAYEARLADLTKEEVIGKNFFKQVAPCTDVREFYGRFRDGIAASKLHCKFRYYFSFKRNPITVTITLFYSDRNKTVWVFVQPIESQNIVLP
jgi:photoactive yellow protein